MATRTITKCAGLYTNPNDVGQVPEGALAQADNVVVSRDGVCEPRRGEAIISTAPGPVDKLMPYAGRFVAHSGNSLFYSSADVTSWSSYSGTFTAVANEAVRAAVANQNLYFTTSAGVKRLDSVTGTPETAGMPSGLDLQLTLDSSGTPAALPNNAQVAYRLIWGKRDANNNLLLGPPSGRAVISNTSGATRDVDVAYSIPHSLPSGAFFQAYRTNASVSSSTDPGDEMIQVYQGTPPQPTTATQLVRVSNVVTATTPTAHGYSTGMTVRVYPGGSGSGAGAILPAVGPSSAAASSPDGTTWTSRTIPAGSYFAVAWNGSVFVAVGANVAATSSDGINWTSRTIPSGMYTGIAWNGSVFAAVGGSSKAATSPDGITWTSRTMPNGSYQAVAWDGSVFAAVGAQVAATSPDGITWAARTIPTGTFNGAVYYGVAWNGSVFAAIGTENDPINGLFAAGRAATSPDGVTWTARSIPGGNYWYAVAWNGSVFAAVGQSSNAATSPDGITWTGRTISGGTYDYDAVAWNTSAFVAVGNSVAATSPDGTTWTSRTIPSGIYQAVTNGNPSAPYFSSGEKIITSSPTSTTFTYAETGADGTLTATETLTPLSGAFTDSIATANGAALYTNQSQQGIGGANYMVGGAKDLAVFRNCLFLSNILNVGSVDIFLLGVGGSTGVQSGDTITIDGLAYTAGASESISGRTFQLFTSGTASQNILQTSQSLIRILNRTQSNTVYAVDISDPNAFPGHILVSELTPASQISVSFSGHANAWSIGTLTPQGAQLNRLYYSQQQQPDGVPLTNWVSVGAADKAILRIVALRDSLIPLKQDGIYRVTGYSPADFRVDPLDLTVNLVASETAVALENTVVALTQQGVVRVSDTGVTVISRPIENLLLPLIAPAMVATTQAVAFAIAYESARKYILYMPTVSSDTVATQAFVYDLFTETWTHWTLPAACGVVNPADDRLYLANGTTVRQERKAFDVTDYADETYAVSISSHSGTSVTLSDATNALVGDRLVQGALTPGAGALVTAKNGNTLTLDRMMFWSNSSATVYRAFLVIVKWTPAFAAPALWMHAREVDFFFRGIYFANAMASYWTDITVAGNSLSVVGSNYPLADPPLGPLMIRTGVPINEQRCTRLSVAWSQTQAQSQLQIQGMQVVYEPGGVKLTI